MAMLLMVFLSIGLAVVAVPVEAMDRLRITHVDWRLLVFGLIVQLSFLATAAEIWGRLLRLQTGAEIGIIVAYLQLATISIGKYIPGKVWGFLARAGQLQRHDVSMRAALGSSVVEQALLLAGAVLVAAVTGVVILPQHRVLIVAAGIAMLAILLFISRHAHRVAGWLWRRRSTTDVLETRSEPMPVRSLLQFTGSYAVLWLQSGVVFSLIYFAIFDAEPSVERIAALILGNTSGIALGFFAFFAPGGVGVREVVAVAVGSNFLPLREVLLAAVVYRSWAILFDAINAGLLALSESRQLLQR